ncbi:MAG: hypothetical protein IT213_08675 [Cytophagales bacterium]|mgnify:CR=1 FL=1|nr:hypothetical protein [Cytophagales bacterium]HRG11326.1 hypothetical protein [Cyclobacteriaceae bacterium]
MKIAVVGGGKILLKGGIKLTGSHTWGATKSYWTKNGITELMGGSKHHWLISQSWMKQSPTLMAIGNQPWNIIKFTDHATHMRFAHGKTFRGVEGLGLLGRAWYGTPTWFGSGMISGGYRLIE